VQVKSDNVNDNRSRLKGLTMKKILCGMLSFVALFIGCLSVDDAKPKPRPQRKEWPQKCEMCGAEWLVVPVENPDEVIPPTVEWCFNDGHYCEVGFQLILKKNHVLVAELNDIERQFLNHCLSCQGCRCAAFKPHEWRKITDAIKKVRSDPSPF
jgi:hypothetical protein